MEEHIIYPYQLTLISNLVCVVCKNSEDRKYHTIMVPNMFIG